MKHKRNWIIGIVLSITATFVALQTINVPTQDEIAITQTLTTVVEVPIAETSASLSRDCYFVWATKDAPELTAILNIEIKKINRNASVNVTYYGEDCVYEDDRSTFGAMETDFQIRLQVNDLSKYEDFGNWISQTMQVVTKITREEIQGNWGYVEFWFEKNEVERIIFRVPIQKYIDEAKGKTGLELFNYFYQP